MNYLKISIINIILLSTMALGGCGVRLPDNYAYAIDQAAKTNEILLEKVQDKPLNEKIEIYEIIIIEDIKTLKGIAKTIRAGGGD